MNAHAESVKWGTFGQDLAEAQRFLSALDPRATAWTFQTFDDNADRKDRKLARVFHGTLAQHEGSLIALQAAGAGVFVTINETNLKGRETPDIVSVRAAFTDLDGAPLEPVTAWEMPHILVDSSPERFHAYWLVDGLRLEQFKPMQKKLIAAFQADNIHDLPRVMRLPGFYHQKVDSSKGLIGTQYMVRMRNSNDAPGPFSAEDFLAKVAALADAASPQLPEHATASRGTDMPQLRELSAATAPLKLSEQAAMQISTGSDTRLSDEDYATLLQEMGVQGKMHFATLKFAMGFAGKRVPEWVTRTVIYAHCPKRDANLENNIISAYAKHPPIDGRGPAPDRKSQFYSASDLQGKPVMPREWLVDDLVPQKTVTLFSGDGGTGKSLLALQLAVAAAAGRAWLGRHVKAGSAIYLSAEDDDEELHRRLADIVRASGLTFGDTAGLTLRSLAGEDAQLAVETTAGLMQTALMDELDKRADGDCPQAIILDTSADLFGGNENDRPQVRRFIGFLRGLALRHSCAVILLSHPSLTGLSSGSGLSGSTAWNNSVRSRIYMQRAIQDGYEADPDKRILTVMKANHARVGSEIQMTWRDGVFVADTSPTGLDAMAAAQKGERIFLHLLDELSAQGRKVNPSGSGTYAPKVFAANPKAEGMTKRALAAAMEALLHRGVIEVGHDGPPSRRVSFLKRKVPE